MQQGSVLEHGRHGPCPSCQHLHRQAQNSDQMGEQGVCSGMATLHKPISICGMSHRWGEGTAVPCTEITCCPSTTIWNRRKVKTLWREMDPVMNKLQYHTRMMHCQLTTQPKGNWKVCLVHHQNRTNCLTQGQLGRPAWIQQMEGSKLTMIHLFHQGKAGEQWGQWGTNPNGVTRILHYSKMTSLQVSSIFELAYASAFTSTHACTWSLWGIQCEPLYLNHCKSAHYTNSWHCWGYMSTLWYILDGGVDQRIFGQSTAAPLEKPKSNSQQRSCGCLGSMTLKAVCTQ